MQNPWVERINHMIAWSFYAIFFLVPLIIYPSTYELFEFNKMWLVFGVSLIILFLWISKIVVTGNFQVKRTPLDIPILLFLASQIISTIFSLDQHVSWWGYYSRFNGGLLSIICYIFLYYAFASNLIHKTEDERTGKSFSFKLLVISLISGTIVAFWGFPSHFGYDPTCLVFRGTFDVSCWTADFQPMVRLFSTLGQPNWLAAYLTILIPIAIALTLSSKIPSIRSVVFGTLAILFYVELLWTSSQSGFLGFWAGNIIFITLFLIKTAKVNHFKFSNIVKEKIFQVLLSINVILLLFSFFIGVPNATLSKFTFSNLIPKESQEPSLKSTSQTKTEKTSSFELGGSDSGRIRLIVWQGALEIFKKNPLIGSGVETFAYAYYKVKPQEHNLTSEWDFLYNKAHNEYLNYLATTGIFGLGSYLLFIGWFIYKVIKHIISNFKFRILSIALVGSFVSILVSNFFGFSVVIVNLYLFLIPIFVFDLANLKMSKNLINIQFVKNEMSQRKDQGYNIVSLIIIAIIGLIVLYMEFSLLRFWIADQKYALGYNLDKAFEYPQANTPLTEAVMMQPNEHLYKDELSLNLAVLSLGFSQQGQSTQAAQLAIESKALSDDVIKNHPNNVVYYKTRTRVLFALSDIEPGLAMEAIDTLKTALTLAPTDAKIIYNLALLYKNVNEEDLAIETLKTAIKIKPNYRDVYYYLGVYLSEKAKEQKDNRSKELKQEAIQYLEYTLKNIEPNDGKAKELLTTLKSGS